MEPHVNRRHVLSVVRLTMLMGFFPTVVSVESIEDLRPSYAPLSNAVLTSAAESCSAAVDREELVSFPSRRQAIKRIVIHSTGAPDCNQNGFRSGTLDSNIEYFREAAGKVGSEHLGIHYLIDRNGTIVRMVSDTEVAYHVRGHNAESIGIELVNNSDGRDAFDPRQTTALTNLVTQLAKCYGLKPEDIVGHSILDTRHFRCRGRDAGPRRVDPGSNFPWDSLRAALEANLAH